MCLVFLFFQSLFAHEWSQSYQVRYIFFLLTVRCRMGKKKCLRWREIFNLSCIIDSPLTFCLAKTPELHSRRPLIQILGGPNIFMTSQKFLLSMSGSFCFFILFCFFFPTLPQLLNLQPAHNQHSTEKSVTENVEIKEKVTSQILLVFCAVFVFCVYYCSSIC